MQWKHFALTLALVFSLTLSAIPVRVLACEGPACHAGVGVIGGFRRPICPIGRVNPGCVAPIRKAGRFLGRVGLGAARAVGRVGVGIARGVGRVARGVGRFLFGRRRFI